MPYATLIRDKAGNFYGTTAFGGDGAACPGGCGTVFKLDSSGSVTVLYSFVGGTDGIGPLGALVLDPEGNLYGTTSGGGTSGNGTVFKLDPATKQENVLYSFTGGTDGGNPYSNLVRDSNGTLYGTSLAGGDLNCSGADGFSGCGTVFGVNTVGKEVLLHTFHGTPDGASAYAGLIRDSAGNFYGTTALGGKSTCPAPGCGTVFEVSAERKYSVLYNFVGGTQGDGPVGGLVQDSAGNFYGTTGAGGDLGCSPAMGTNGCGTVFKLDTSFSETILHSFTGPPDGELPVGTLIRTASGNLYGMTLAGGDTSCSSPEETGDGCGVIFEISAAGKEKILHSFSGGATDGANPYDGLTAGAGGSLYGVTYFGGDTCLPGIGYTCGVVFQITP